MQLPNQKHFTINRPRHFVAKLVALVVFSAAFIPLAELKSSTPFAAYLSFLIALHVFFLGVLFFDVRASNYKSKGSLFLRLLAITGLIGALMALGRSPIRADIVAFLGISFVLHVGLLSALHLQSGTTHHAKQISQRYPQKTGQRLV